MGAGGNGGCGWAPLFWVDWWGREWGCGDMRWCFTAVVMKPSLGLVLIRGVRTAGYVGAEVFGGLNGFVLVELWIFSILGGTYWWK